MGVFYVQHVCVHCTVLTRGDLYVCIVVDAHCCVHDLVCLAVIPWQDSKVGASSSTMLTCDKFIAELLEHWTAALYCNVLVLLWTLTALRQFAVHKDSVHM